MKYSYLKFLPFIAISLLFTSCLWEEGVVPETVPMDFCDSLGVTWSNDIEPIIQNSCAIPTCHVPGGSGTGDFTSYAGIKAKADDGSLNNRVLVLENMPPPQEPPLTELEKDKIECWLQDGAPNN